VTLAWASRLPKSAVELSVAPKRTPSCGLLAVSVPAAAISPGWSAATRSSPSTDSIIGGRPRNAATAPAGSFEIVPFSNSPRICAGSATPP